MYILLKTSGVIDDSPQIYRLTGVVCHSLCPKLALLPDVVGLFSLLFFSGHGQPRKGINVAIVISMRGFPHKHVPLERWKG